MADFDLSMIVTGDGSGAVAAGKTVAQSLDAVDAAQKKVASSAGALDVAETKAAASAGKLASEQTKANAAVTSATTAHAAASAALRKATAETDANAKALARAGFGARNLGQQVGDFATQVSLGGGVVRAFSSQIGQAGFALSEMNGKAGAIGRFLVGPWGIALTVATLVLAPFVEKLFQGAEAAKAAELATSGFADAQGAVADAVGKSSSKIAEQNELLKINARLLATNLRAKSAADAEEARATLRRTATAAKYGGLVNAGLSLTGQGYAATTGNNAARDIAGRARIANNIKDPAARARELDKLLVQSRGVDFAGSGITREEFGEAISKAAASRANDAIADLIDKSLDDNKVAPQLAKAGAKGRKTKTPKAKTDRTTPGEAEAIAQINAEYDRQPTLIDRAAAATRKLDKIIADLSKRKPPGFEKLIADATAAKALVQEGLTRPYREFLDQQAEGLEVQKLVAEGRYDEANALRTIQSLQAQMGPLTLEQKDAVLATVQALRAEQREIDIVREKNQKFVEALGGIKGIVEEATQAFVRGDLGQLIKSPGKLLDVFQTLQGRKLFDKIFGDVFRELSDEVNGTTVVKDASDRMAKAVDKVTAQTKITTGALDDLARAAGGAASAVGGGSVGSDGGVTSDGDTTTVIAKTKRADVFTGFFDKAFAKLGIKDPKFFGRSIGENAGKALQGAATGSIVSGVAKAVGIKLNKTGSQIGGALGSFLPIPGGDIIGSLAGGLLGNLLTGKAKPGGATITGGAGGSTIGATGADKAGIAAGKGLAGAVVSGVNQIVEQLGGTAGSYNVSIGKYKDDLRVNVGGKALGGVKGSGAQGFGDDEAAAVSAAIALAVSQGAVQGLSAAVQKALSSSADLDKALAEALKVKEVEALIGGLGSQLKQQFDAFDRQAAERVRIAKAYGLDLIAVEKINGEQRAKLVDDALKARVASLATFLDSVKFGDLFEGTAADKRTALLAERDKAQKDAEAGVEGAADKLATISQSLLALTRDAFGTAGSEYTGDRSSTISGIERVIQMETDRVNQAAGITVAQSAALEKANALTSETNDLLAVQTTQLSTIAQLLSSGNVSGVDYSLTSRVAA